MTLADIGSWSLVAACTTSSHSTCMAFRRTAVLSAVCVTCTTRQNYRRMCCSAHPYLEGPAHVSRDYNRGSFSRRAVPMPAVEAVSTRVLAAVDKSTNGTVSDNAAVLHASKPTLTSSSSSSKNTSSNSSSSRCQGSSGCGDGSSSATTTTGTSGSSSGSSSGIGGDGSGSAIVSSSNPTISSPSTGTTTTSSSSSSSSSLGPSRVHQQQQQHRQQINPKHAALSAYEEESRRLLRRLQELQQMKQQVLTQLKEEDQTQADDTGTNGKGGQQQHPQQQQQQQEVQQQELQRRQVSPQELEDATRRLIFPFTAIVGQDEMKLSLILNVIDPKIGGVMIMGDRGTGKTTAVRALADLLPEMKVVDKDCFNSDPDNPDLMGPEVRERVRRGQPLALSWMKIPLVDLPLGATEDRVCGTIDIEKALSEGVKAFEPGLLARANRGILYVDEVNLLDDHLVDVLLDSAASGWNTVEREGISISHPARFILVGSGNPEEGELRPQLLDRFGMHAAIRTVKDPKMRVQIVAERSKFDEDPVAFAAQYEEKQHRLTQRIIEAQKLARRVEISYDLKMRISQVCSDLNVDGIRGDIVTTRAAKALAAFEGRTEVTIEDVYRVIVMSLRHRLRKDPLAEVDDGERVRDMFKKVFAID